MRSSRSTSPAGTSCAWRRRAAPTAPTAASVWAVLGLITDVVRDLRAARDRDPAARGVTTPGILLTWPGVHALLAHRLAQRLDAVGVPVVPRVISATARTITRVEIHPAARIGPGLFIDHGSGVVI